jgi:hypothetical protein
MSKLTILPLDRYLSLAWFHLVRSCEPSTNRVAVDFDQTFPSERLEELVSHTQSGGNDGMLPFRAVGYTKADYANLVGVESFRQLRETLAKLANPNETEEILSLILETKAAARNIEPKTFFSTNGTPINTWEFVEMFPQFTDLRYIEYLDPNTILRIQEHARRYLFREYKIDKTGEPSGAERLLLANEGDEGLYKSAAVGFKRSVPLDTQQFFLDLNYNLKYAQDILTSRIHKRKDGVMVDSIMTGPLFGDDTNSDIRWISLWVKNDLLALFKNIQFKRKEELADEITSTIWRITAEVDLEQATQLADREMRGQIERFDIDQASIYILRELYNIVLKMKQA